MKPNSSPPKGTSEDPVLDLDDADHKQRQEWAKSQIVDINSSARTELESLDVLRSQQQENYKEQVAEKHDVWVRLIAQRREEAAELRSMISSLSAAISSARLEAKNEIDGAKRKASASTKTTQLQWRKQLEQIAALEQTIEAEKRQYEHDLNQFASQSDSAADGKKDQIGRLKLTLATLQGKLRDKLAMNEAKFTEQVQGIQALREQLQQVREAENAKQTELMSMRKVCASLSKKISARKDEAASLKRQYQMMKRDNEELEGEITKMEVGMAASLPAFRP
jgi:chromosome segregation ATPase